ncbi:hypothetical protein [Tahibacter harae]|uniref:Delta-60 repeat protein n=1 Tax=Tahibacter harae TaxID=2963937 RepID=A0ABT1QUX8_9GAMM|nr:hypothetical protein [Tahibacter harae]MCQ4166092.1 hypothetical protein [Tahibacter harae]
MSHRRRRCALLALCFALAGPASAADGDPDPAFSGDGKAYAEWASPARRAQIATTSTGQVYVGATTLGTTGGDNFAVAKFTQAGALVAGFGFAGYRTVDFSIAGSPASNDQLLGLFPLSSGGVQLAGSANLDDDFNQYPALAQLTTNGDADTAIGTGGKRGYQNAAWPAATLLTSAAARQADGKLVFAGVCHSCPEASVHKVFLLRVAADGTPDSTFGSGGWALLQRAGTFPTSVTAMTVDAQGRIVVTGNVDEGSGAFAFLARTLANGNPDVGFSGSGWSIVNPQPSIASGTWTPAALAANPDGTVVFAMNWWHATEPQRSVLLRRTAAGALDYGFGGGFVELTRDAGSRIGALARRSDGRIVAAGWVYSAAAGTDFFAARVHADGTLDNTFDNNGVVRLPMHNGNNRADALTLDAGRPLIAGSLQEADPTHIGVLRLSSDLIFSDRFEERSAAQSHSGHSFPPAQGTPRLCRDSSK